MGLGLINTEKLDEDVVMGLGSIKTEKLDERLVVTGTGTKNDVEDVDDGNKSDDVSADDAVVETDAIKWLVVLNENLFLAFLLYFYRGLKKKKKKDKKNEGRGIHASLSWKGPSGLICAGGDRAEPP